MWDLIILYCWVSQLKNLIGPIEISLIVLSWHDTIQGHKLFTKVMKIACIYDNVP